MRNRKLCILLLVGILISINLINFCYASDWSEDRKLTDTLFDSVEPAVSIYFNSIYVVWREFSKDNDTSSIYFKKSLDGGDTWSEDKLLVPGSRYSGIGEPSIDFASGIIRVVYDSDSGLNYIESSDGGENWSEPVKLDSSGSRSYPRIFSNSNKVHVMWWERVNNCFYQYGKWWQCDEIFYTRSLDGGDTWSGSIRLTYLKTYSSTLKYSVTQDVNRIFLTFSTWFSNYGSDVYFKKSLDEGDNWGSDIRLTYNGKSTDPSITSDLSGLHLVYSNLDVGSVYYKKSLNDGDTWSVGENLYYDYSFSRYPSIDSNSEELYVVWLQKRDTDEYALYYIESSDGGENWGEPELLISSIDPGNNLFFIEPEIYASQNSVYVFWANNSNNNFDIYFKKTMTLPTCDDGIQNGDETGVDCGGSCAPCGSCSDGIQNGNEEGVDCGGSCPFVCGYCKPLIVNGDHKDKIDVVFVPDQSYNGNLNLFKEHIDMIINNSYKNSTPINNNINKFNFYYIEEEAKVNWTTWKFNTPKKLKKECSFYDAVAVIHTDRHGDFRIGKIFSSEYYNYGTFLHESGHALFDLADEYCCDSHYRRPQPFPNIYPNKTDCRQDASNEGWNPDDCNFFCDPALNVSPRKNNCGDGWWRSDPVPDIMEDDGDDIVPPFQRADLRNVYWTFDQYPGTTMKSMTAKLTGQIEDTKVAILDLYFKDNEINLTELRIIYNDAPDYVSKSGDINVKLVKGNYTIKDINIWDPRIIFTEEEAFYLNEGNSSVSLKVRLDEDYINFSNSSGTTLLSVNLTQYFEDFCSFKDGKCDLDCSRKDIDWPSGDVDLNQKVDIFDLAKIGLCYGLPASGDCENADLSGNGMIDIFDLATVGLNYGRSC